MRLLFDDRIPHACDPARAGAFQCRFPSRRATDGRQSLPRHGLKSWTTFSIPNKDFHSLVIRTLKTSIPKILVHNRQIGVVRLPVVIHIEDARLAREIVDAAGSIFSTGCGVIRKSI